MDAIAVIGHRNESRSVMLTLMGRELSFTNISFVYNSELLHRVVISSPVNPLKAANNSEFTLKKQTTSAFEAASARVYKHYSFCLHTLPLGVKEIKQQILIRL